MSEMKQISFGPVKVRLGRDRFSRWGQERLRVGGLSLFSGASDGSLVLAAYHPRTCPTWHWSVGLTRRQPHLKRWLTLTAKEWRRGQWHDYVKLPLGWALSFSRQDYHRQSKP